MPMSWTAEKDQLLLLRILDLNSSVIDYKRIAETWPGPDKPTPKAISEHIRILRQRQPARDGASGAGSNAFTPKSRGPKTPRSTAKTPKSAKRKLQEISDGATNQDPFVKVKEQAKEPSIKGEEVDMMKYINFDSEDSFIASQTIDTPTKRSRKASSQPEGMVAYPDEEEDGHDSSYSEFIPDENENIKSEDDMDMVGYA